jgi:hypothetical protein
MTSSILINVYGELLEELIVRWKFTLSGGRSLKMTTPHLKCFTWGGFASDNCFLGKLKCLRSCALSLEQLSSSWRPPYLEFFHIRSRTDRRTSDTCAVS